MHLEFLPKRLKKFKKFWIVREVVVEVLRCTDEHDNVIHYYNSNESLKTSGYYTPSSYKPNINLNIILDKPKASWSLRSVYTEVIDFDPSGEIGHYLFSLFEYFSVMHKTFKWAKQVYKANPDSEDLKANYESAKKDLFEIRNVINTCSKFSPVFEEIKEYCMYLVNIGVTSEDFIKKDFRTVM